MLKKNPRAGILIALLATMPHVYAEYRRLIVGEFDLIYWLLTSFIIISFICVYKIVYPYCRGNDQVTVICNAISVCCIIIGIFCFAVSGTLRLLFN